MTNPTPASTTSAGTGLYQLYGPTTILAPDIFNLIRMAETENGTFGALFYGFEYLCMTLERKWLNNERGKSCFPRGRYFTERVISPKFGDTFRFQDVPGRSEILFHWGNLDDDSHGCVILGTYFGEVKDSVGLTGSKTAFAKFMAKADRFTQFQIEVRYL